MEVSKKFSRKKKKKLVSAVWRGLEVIRRDGQKIAFTRQS